MRNEVAPFESLPANYQSLFSIGNTQGLSGNLAFSVNIMGYYRVMVLDLDSKRIRKIVDGPGNNSYPSWSPSGEVLAFTSDRDGNAEIYMARWDGQNQKRLTRNTVTDDNPSWAPDGASIVYYSETGPSDSASSETNIFSLKVKDPNPVQITKLKKRNTTPRWSPDGTMIAFSTNRFWPGWDICLWKVATHTEDCILSGALSYCRPSFRPDGKALAYSGGTFGDIDVSTIAVDTKAISAVTDLPGREYDVSWSPDGSGMAFTAENGRKGIFSIFFVRPGNAPAPLITSNSSIRYLAWSAARTIDLEAKRIREESY